MGLEGLIGLVAVAVWIVFVTLGCVLLVSFWAQTLSVAARALLATAAGALVLLIPVMLIGEAQDEALAVLLGGSIFVGIIGFPAAFLATRKLQRQHHALTRDFGSVFE